MDWSARDEWASMLELVFSGHFDEVLNAFDMTDQNLVEELGDAFGMIYAWVLEDFFTMEFDDGLNIVDDYLKRRGWREKAPAKRYLRALRHSAFSLYEIVDVEPGKAMTVRDLIFGGDSRRVNEVSGSQSVHKWDRIAARVVTVNKKLHFTGALLPFTRDAADELLGALDDAFKKAKAKLRRAAKKAGEPTDFDEDALKRMILVNSPELFTQVWLTFTLEKLAAPRPEIRNLDGHDIMFSEVRFPIWGSRESITDALAGMEDFEADDDEGKMWSWLGGETPPAGPPNTDGLTYMVSHSSGRHALGQLDVTQDQIVLSANSRERAERGRDLLASRLGRLVGRPLVSFETLDAALENPRRKSQEQEEIPPENQQRIMTEYFDAHYRQALDKPLPMLNGKTPRQAAKSKKGREKVIEWLKLLENSEARRANSDGQAPYDFRWMWRELKVNNLLE